MTAWNICVSTVNKWKSNHLFYLNEVMAFCFVIHGFLVKIMNYLGNFNWSADGHNVEASSSR